MIATLLGATSCGDEPDGQWAKMKWTNVNNLMNDQGVYYLPEDGGSYTFLCRNYEQPWIASVTVDGVMQVISNENRKEFNGEWFTLRFEGNKLIISAESLPESVESRGFHLQVTAGNIFDTLLFSQQQNRYTLK